MERMGFIADKYFSEAEMLDHEYSSTWRAIN